MSFLRREFILRVRNSRNTRTASAMKCDFGGARATLKFAGQRSRTRYQESPNSSPSGSSAASSCWPDLRHTTATLLLSKGVTPKVVAERLGNDVQTLLRHYAHVLPA